MPTNYADLSAAQNFGQSFGTCDASAIVWNTARIGSGLIDFQLLDISCADDTVWDTATFYFGIFDVDKNHINSVNISKTWGVQPAQVNLGSYYGAFYTASAASLWRNDTGWLDCRWGSWAGTLYY